MVAPVNNTATAATGPASNAAANARREQLRAAAQQFEAIFLRQMIGSIRQAKLSDDAFGSQSTEQFTEMSDARLADQMASKGQFGVADLLMKQFERRVGG